MENNKKLRTITGIIYSTKKNGDSKAISFLLDSLDDDQDTYTISSGKKSSQLLGMINKKVEIHGTVSETPEGNLVIHLINFKQFEET